MSQSYLRRLYAARPGRRELLLREPTNGYELVGIYQAKRDIWRVHANQNFLPRRYTE